MRYCEPPESTPVLWHPLGPFNSPGTALWGRRLDHPGITPDVLKEIMWQLDSALHSEGAEVDDTHSGAGRLVSGPSQAASSSYTAQALRFLQKAVLFAASRGAAAVSVRIIGHFIVPGAPGAIFCIANRPAAWLLSCSILFLTAFWVSEPQVHLHDAPTAHQHPQGSIGPSLLLVQDDGDQHLEIAPTFFTASADLPRLAPIAVISSSCNGIFAVGRGGAGGSSLPGALLEGTLDDASSLGLVRLSALPAAPAPAAGALVATLARAPASLLAEEVALFLSLCSLNMCAPGNRSFITLLRRFPGGFGSARCHSAWHRPPTSVSGAWWHRACLAMTVSSRGRQRETEVGRHVAERSLPESGPRAESHSGPPAASRTPAGPSHSPPAPAPSSCQPSGPVPPAPSPGATSASQPPTPSRPPRCAPPPWAPPGPTAATRPAACGCTSAAPGCRSSPM